MKNKITLLLLLFAISSIAQDITNNYLLVINAYNRYNTPQKALKYYNKNKLNTNNNIELQLSIGTTYYLIGDYKTATNIFIKANKLAPKKTYYKLAQCYAQLNKPEFSVKYLRRYLQLKIKKMQRTIKSDVAFNKIKHTQEWKNLWQEKEWYSKYDLMLEDAWYEYDLKHYNESLNILDKLNSFRKSMVEAYYLKALNYINIYEFKNALTSINTAINKRNKVAKYYNTKANIENKLKKYGKALKTINIAISLDSINIDYYFTQADIYLNNNNVTIAESIINSLVSIVPNFNTYLLAGNIFYTEKKYQDALKYYNKCILLNDSTPNIYMVRGDTFFNMFAYEFAEKDYTMALDFTPYNGELYYKRGLARKLMHKKYKA